MLGICRPGTSAEESRPVPVFDAAIGAVLSTRPSGRSAVVVPKETAEAFSLDDLSAGAGTPRPARTPIKTLFVTLSVTKRVSLGLPMELLGGQQFMLSVQLPFNRAIASGGVVAVGIPEWPLATLGFLPRPPVQGGLTVSEKF